MRRFSKLSLRRTLAFLSTAALFAAIVPTPALAQWPAAQQQAPQTAAPAPVLSPEQLDDLVAPIALYPDPLLGQALVASTYPLELVEAEQWLRSNPSLQGQQLVDAAKQQNWDASVQAMVALPKVLSQLTQNISWTTDLGNAFLAQQSDVMDAVQRMRARAQANGHLSSTPQETVSAAVQGGQNVIQIVPTSPDVVYVPAYDPAYIWGPPAWGFYPALWYPSYGFGFWPGINIGFCFGGWGGWGGWGAWGWGPGWFNRTVFVNNTFFTHFGFRNGFRAGGWGRGFGGGRFAWSHDPTHRLGVAYPNRQLTARFGAASAASRANWTRSGFNSFGARNSFGTRNSFGQPFGGTRGRDSFGQASGGNRGRDSFGQPYGNRGNYSAPGATTHGFQGSQGFRGGTQPGFSRGYQAPTTRSNAPSFRGTPAPTGGGFRGFNGSAPAFRGNSGGNHSFSSPAPGFRAPSFPGGNFGGASRSFSAPRSFGGGGGGAPRSFGGGGGGGGARSFGGGGGGRSFGGGGGHSFGGGGGHSGGGGHGGRR